MYSKLNKNEIVGSRGGKCPVPHSWRRHCVRPNHAVVLVYRRLSVCVCVSVCAQTDKLAY